MLGGFGSVNSSKMSQGVNFRHYANELEDEIQEVMKELGFLKKEV